MTNTHRYTPEYFAARERSPAFRLEVAAFRRALGQRNRVVEAGAGAGALAMDLASSADQWIATDMDVDPMRHLRSKNILVAGCDVTRLPVPTASVDGVVAQHVIEHFADPVSVLVEWRRVLRPGGVCVVTTPNRHFPNPEWFEDPTHHELFDAERLSNTFKRAGFTRVRVTMLVPWLGSIRLVFLSARIQRYLLGLPIPSRRALNLFAVAQAGS